MKNALIIFMKNPVYGKVKTRLAATVGNDKALQIYKYLVRHTYSVTHKLPYSKVIFYSDEIIFNDEWTNDYQKQIQQGNDLGERMKNAFAYIFQQDHFKTIVIGTDCAELSTEILEQAFKKLDEYDVVIGPAADGGYYLLGMKKLREELFDDIEWSTTTVLSETINRCNKNNITCFLLPQLHDLDEEKDLKYINLVNL